MSLILHGLQKNLKAPAASASLTFLRLFTIVFIFMRLDNTGMRPAIFLDRDGTLIEDRGHLRSPADVCLFPDTCAALRALARHFLFFMVTNQRGVADGILSLADVERVNAHLLAMLATKGISFRAIYVCPHRREDACACIKPQPFFLHQAARDYHVDLSRSYMIGDHPHDVECAANAGARGIYILTGHGQRHRHELRDGFPVVHSLSEASSLILTEKELNDKLLQETDTSCF